MQFDLKKYHNTGKRPYEVSFTADFTGRSFAGARISEPVEAQFAATFSGDDILLSLRAKATVHGECARCLDMVEQEYEVNAEWTVRERDLDDPDFELPLDEKGKLDVEEWLFQEFSFQIPTVLVCSADCQGLCPVCGKKQGQCSCERADDSSAPADARLSVLKSLLN